MPKDKRKAPKVTPPVERQPVKQGDVIASLAVELPMMLDEVKRHRVLMARLSAYEKEHPERAAHLLAFVAGG